MTNMLRQLITCRWSARRIQRYLDADPAAPLAPGEIVRLEAHLAVCERCQQVAREHRVLHRALAHWPGAQPDDASVARLRLFLAGIGEDEQG